ncbi:MAG: hypothetical protein LBU29_01370 [Endomicrobium sp.]|jgi:hypothetical protein|nr:hypothetical protein [Endomicrobium sp.]
MRQYIFDNKGQSLVEALVVVMFITVIVLLFIKICKIVVDGMLANEAAFVAARSAAVTKMGKRSAEAKNKIKNYLAFFSCTATNFDLMFFTLSNKKSVVKYFKKSDGIGENILDEMNDSLKQKNKSVNIWKGRKHARDYSGQVVTKETVKIYYSARLLFNRRYQAARNRMVASPDEKYYYKAFPEAKKFEE